MRRPAVQRYIRRHLTDPDLDPDTVAAAIGCSRSTLYRLFNGNELFVQGYVRELRLQQFLRLLQKDARNAPIYALAQRYSSATLEQHRREGSAGSGYSKRP